MGLGLGIVLLVAGAVLYWAVDVDIPGIEDNTLGMILMIAGAAALVLGLVMNAQRGRSKTVVEERRNDGV